MQTWHEAIGAEKQQPYFQHIIHSVHNEREAGQIVYPPAADVVLDTARPCGTGLPPSAESFTRSHSDP